MTFDLNYQQTVKLEETLKELSKVALPIAVQQTLNNTARNAHRNYRSLTRKKYQLRNTWTIRSEQYTQTKSLNINSMKSIAGSIAEYMEKQEEGFTRDSSNGVTIPTASAANQSGSNRTRPVLKKFRRASIDRRKTRKSFQYTYNWKNKKQIEVADLIDTMRSGNRFWYGTLKGNKGIWFLKGGRLKSKRGGWPKGMSPHLIYSANKQSVRTQGGFLVKEASDKAITREFDEYQKALSRQLKRLKAKHNL